MQAYTIFATMVGAVMVMVIILIIIYASRYKKVPPSTAMVIYGKGTDIKKGFQVITSGGKLILPVVQSYDLLPLDVRTLELVMRDVVVKGPDMKMMAIMNFVTQIRISHKPELIDNAVRNLLHKSDPEINSLAQETIEGITRRISAQTDIVWIFDNRDEFSMIIEEKSARHLADYGLEVKSLVMKQIEDSHGYLYEITKKRINDRISSIRKEQREL